MTLSLKSVDARDVRYSVVIRPDQYEDGTLAYIAEIPELPGCKSHGATPAEARAGLADAQREYIEALVEQGLEIPPPSRAVDTAVWTVQVPQLVPDRVRHQISEWPTVKGWFTASSKG